MASQYSRLVWLEIGKTNCQAFVLMSAGNVFSFTLWRLFRSDFLFTYFCIITCTYMHTYKLCLFVCSSTCFLFRCERFFSSLVLYKYFLRFLFREYYLVHTLCGCCMQRTHIPMYVCVLCSGGCSADFQGFIGCVALAFIVIALLLFLLLLHIFFDGFMIICLLLCCAFFVIYLSLVLQLLARFQRVCSVVVFVFITVVVCLSCRINVKHAVINVLFA